MYRLVEEIKNIHTKKSSFKLRILCKNGNVDYSNQQELSWVRKNHDIIGYSDKQE